MTFYEMFMATPFQPIFNCLILALVFERSREIRELHKQISDLKDPKKPSGGA